MKGGILLVQGPGGVGKTEITKQLAELHFRLVTKYSDFEKLFGLWILSPINKQLDDIADKVFQDCMEQYKQLKADGFSPKYPIVIRRHMGDTERKVYRKDAEASRDRILEQHQPLYFATDEAQKAELEEEDDLDDDSWATEDAANQARELARLLVTDVKMQKAFSDPTAFTFDKRL